MSRKRVKNSVEHFYFTLDDWNREYGFEVNRHKWELSPHHYAERDEIKIVGRLRNKTRRKFTAGVAHILPSYIPRDDQEEFGADRIGNVWTEKGAIFCSAFVPADAYFSLPPCFEAGQFREMEWRVNNLWYRKGEMDSIWLRGYLSELESQSRDYQEVAPIRIDVYE